MAGVNGFAVPWVQMCAWVCPPTNKIVEVVKKVGRSPGMTGLLVIPVWWAAIFWPFICPYGEHVTECFGRVKAFKPFILQGETNGGNNLMKGKTSFYFLALYITAAGRGKIVAGATKVPREVLDV